MNIDLSYIISGFSDKLRAITFFIAKNNKKKNKELIHIYEKKNPQCPFRFIDFCSIKNTRYVDSKKKFSIKNDYLFTSYNSEINKKNSFEANKFYGFRNQVSIKDWKYSYSFILPNKKLFARIKKIKLPKNYISIHIRSTDRSIKFNRVLLDTHLKDMIFEFQLKSFENNIINFVKKYSDCNHIYISSDQEKQKNKIIQILKKNGFHVYYNSCTYNNRNYRKTSGEDFLIDLFCLSYSKKIFSTVGGGVPFTAQLLSKHETVVINWVNEPNIYIIFRLLILLIFYCKRLKFHLFRIFK